MAKHNTQSTATEMDTQHNSKKKLSVMYAECNTEAFFECFCVECLSVEARVRFQVVQKIIDLYKHSSLLFFIMFLGIEPGSLCFHFHLSLSHFTAEPQRVSTLQLNWQSVSDAENFYKNDAWRGFIWVDHRSLTEGKGSVRLTSLHWIDYMSFFLDFTYY